MTCDEQQMSMNVFTLQSSSGEHCEHTKYNSGHYHTDNCPNLSEFLDATAMRCIAFESGTFELLYVPTCANKILSNMT